MTQSSMIYPCTWYIIQTLVVLEPPVIVSSVEQVHILLAKYSSILLVIHLEIKIGKTKPIVELGFSIALEEVSKKCFICLFRDLDPYRRFLMMEGSDKTDWLMLEKFLTSKSKVAST